jgi:hypothetical protein
VSQLIKNGTAKEASPSTTEADRQGTTSAASKWALFEFLWGGSAAGSGCLCRRSRQVCRAPGNQRP